MLACILPTLSKFVALAIASGTASGQLLPDRIYYGLDRPIPMSVLRPGPPSRMDDAAKPDRPESSDGIDPQPTRAPDQIQLLEPESWKVVQSANVVWASGTERTSVDMGAMFPGIWKNPPRLLYAQLVVGGRKIGPAVVLQPMVSPTYAARLDRSGAPVFASEKDAPRVFSGLRAYVAQDVALETSKGRIVIALRPEAAPNTCWWFRELVAGGMYTDVVVHRIASLAGKPEADIVQTGDPNGAGQGGCGEFLDLERSPLPHDFGVVSMARFNDPNSASSQFMIGLNREGTAYLDRKYASFGVVIAGAEVLRAIGASPVGSDNRPKEPPRIASARLVDAAPAGEGPGAERDPLKRTGGR